MHRNDFVRLLAASFALAAIACSPASQAQQQSANTIILEDAWAGATLPSVSVGAGYLTIRNTGTRADTLLSVSTPRAALTQVHEMSIDNGVMRMRALANVPIGAASVVTLAPGGTHIMFMDIDAPFTEGATIPVTLRFEHQGEVEANFIVRARSGHGAHAHNH
ncbi:copper chaperone PCu(A)C [Candidatus Viadribacter manganicus]|uniref:Copper chaperone PCu(A)C n=1 Tax=Candidatus Viadribacter manganicus TaxID=1759059 RepID=A0A1B1AGS7_9PROT|nr:copper chaperone PCu(A)C [Candidatus Viadribacter manganicus]ANP45741.1 hypothetical protein ATE48_07320 [Candidatus Viadribacter manganicus]